MAEPAGLAIGIIGLAGLFISCIDCFDIVIKAREFSEEFDRQCTRLDLWRARFVFWGESVGLVSGPDGTSLPYCQALDRPDLNGRLAQTLNRLQLLLARAEYLRGKYSAPLVTGELVHQTDRVMAFRESLTRLKERLRRGQRQASVTKLTLWAVKDADELRRIVDDVIKFIEDIEGVTSVVTSLDQKYAERRFGKEIQRIMSEETLERLVDVASEDGGSQILRSISDCASQRVSLTQRLNREADGGSFSTQGTSFFTAPSEPRSSVRQRNNTSNPMARRLERAGEAQNLPAAAHHIPAAAANRNVGVEGALTIPQHRRLLADAMASNSQVPSSVNFESGDSSYGLALQATKAEDDKNSRNALPKLLQSADTGSSCLKRMFIELRNIRQGNIPFISAAPVEDRLDRILASIEGPPDTPYEGGIFWVTVFIPEGDFCPKLRFHTRVFHPNIDCLGYICAEFEDQWQAPLALDQYLGSPQSRWYEKVLKPQWTLSSLLVALCGLLASPNLDDPLVPEIALLYLRDPAEYRRCATLYTERHATGARPIPSNLEYAWNSSGHRYGTGEALSDLPTTIPLPTAGVVESTWSISLLPQIITKAASSITFRDYLFSVPSVLPHFKKIWVFNEADGVPEWPLQIRRAGSHTSYEQQIKFLRLLLRPGNRAAPFRSLDAQRLGEPTVRSHLRDFMSTRPIPPAYSLYDMYEWVKSLAVLADAQMLTYHASLDRHDGVRRREMTTLAVRSFLSNLALFESGVLINKPVMDRATVLELLAFSAFQVLFKAFSKPLDANISLPMFLNHLVGVETSLSSAGAFVCDLLQHFRYD